MICVHALAPFLHNACGCSSITGYHLINGMSKARAFQGNQGIARSGDGANMDLNQDSVSMESKTESKIIGGMFGLQATPDSGASMPLARPVAEVLE